MNKIYTRNILFAVLLVLLTVIVVIFRNRSPFGSRESNFSPGTDTKITGIELSGENKSVFLRLENDIWKVNRNGEARKSAVIFLLKMLQELKIKSPVSPEMYENEIISKGIKPVRVKIYEKRKLIRSFYVYRTPSNRYGNIMKISERSRPFIVHFPGYEGDIGSVFNPDELFWKPYILFNILPSEISSVTLENTGDPSSSFSIKRTGNTYELSDLNSILTGWDSARVRRYISYFTMVPFENRAFDISESVKARLQAVDPVFRIKVRLNDGSTINLSLWERFNDGKKDTDRLWGMTDETEGFVIIRYFDIDPLLKKVNYFFPENE